MNLKQNEEESRLVREDSFIQRLKEEHRQYMKEIKEAKRTNEKCYVEGNLKIEDAMQIEGF